MKSYEALLQEQIEQFRNTEKMHDLPPIFHVWSQDYIVPAMQEVFGISGIGMFYVEPFLAAGRHNPSRTPCFLSLGCGDGAIEIAIARTLLEHGMPAFTFVCADLSEILLSRFRASIPAGMEGLFELRAGDLNADAIAAPGGSGADRKYDGIMASHSLHHMVDLEGIYAAAFDSLSDHGVFAANDMIGRNGHMRWPEVRLFIDFVWPFLTARQRCNTLLSRAEPAYIDHDCSTVGFEGVRAQEVLPLLLRQGFHPARFLGFGGLVDVFVDRCFGWHLDPANPDDVFLIRRIGFLNDVLLDAGVVKPTMMLAWFTKQPGEQVYFRNRSAAAAVRDPATEPAWLAGAVLDHSRHPDEPDYAFRQHVIDVLQGQLLDAEGVIEVSRQQLIDAEGVIDVSRQQLVDAEAVIAKLQARISALEGSTSWRMTAPLRSVVGRFR